MRNVILAAILILITSQANAEVSLMLGQRYLGTVSTLGENVSIEDLAQLLGFTSTRAGEELTLRRGQTSIRLIEKSAAAWRGLSITALHSAPSIHNGKFWLDPQSALTLFQIYAGPNDRLRFTNAPIVISEPPERLNLTAPLMPEQPDPELMALMTDSPSTDTPAPEPKPKPLKKQPRLETFRPGITKPEQPESYSGMISSVRWSQTGTKIMAVVETDESADPQVYLSGNELHALFSELSPEASSLKSPYDNIQLTVKQSQSGVELIFLPTGFTKAEKLVLNAPRRIAFDFFYPEEVAKAEPLTPPAISQEPKMPEVPKYQPSHELPKAATIPPSTITIPLTPAAKRKTIVLDAGHGGKDPGASYNGIQEKNINLSVALELERALSTKNYRVVMTRSTDIYLTLQERTDIANRENADLFISIHVNALPSKKTLSGFEIYIMALPTDADAMNLAKVENREYVEGKGQDVANVDRRTEMLLMILGDMQQNNKISESTDFAAALYNAGVIHTLPMRRIAQAPFFVLRGAGMPAVLLEIGFVTNAAEAAQLNSPSYQHKIAAAMAAGIATYLK